MHKQLTKFFPSEVELRLFAGQLAHSIHSGATIFLYGPLGAGKTTFVRGFMRELGYTDKVKSPTYTLIEPYSIAGKNIFHFDLYRINTAKELEYIGISEYFSAESICFVEWPEKGFPWLPQADLAYTISFANEGREVKMDALTERGERIFDLLNISPSSEYK